MVDIVERLRVTLRDADDVYTDVGSDGADEIESLRKRLADEQAHSKQLETGFDKALARLAESQAREKVLRDALGEIIVSYAWLGDPAKKALAMPSDSTAIDSAIRQAKREALLEAATEFDEQGEPTCYGRQLRIMADELKG